MFIDCGWSVDIMQKYMKIVIEYINHYDSINSGKMLRIVKSMEFGNPTIAIPPNYRSKFKYKNLPVYSIRCDDSTIKMLIPWDGAVPTMNEINLEFIKCDKRWYESIVSPTEEMVLLHKMLWAV